MLGKGLESLIPQKGSNNNQNGSNQSSPQPIAPASASALPSSSLSSNPAAFLPDGKNEAERTEKFLPKGISASAPASRETNSFSSGSPVQPARPASSVAESALSLTSISAPRAELVPPPRSSSSLPRVPSSDVLPEPTEAIFQIEVDKIEPNPGQPRRVFDESALRDLAHSIREFGFLQPMVVSKIEKETPMGIAISYQLIAGERRLMAAKLLGLRIVPAIVRKVGLEREKLELAIIENIQRENLNPLETARAFQRLQEEFRMTQREIAAKMGKSREAIANTVRLLDLPIYVQDALGKGELSESHARMLLGVADPGAQKRLFDDILANGLTTRDVKERVKAMTSPRPYHHHLTSENLPAEVKAMQESLSMSLGAPVEIQKTPTNNGKITITFFSQEELESILKRLGSEERE